MASYNSVILPDEQTDIINRYSTGESLNKIMSDYSYAWDTGKRLLQQAGITPFGHYKYNHMCFSGTGEYASYFSGLIVADGCITYQNGHPDIHLASTDLDIIVKFLDFVGAPTKAIYHSKQGVYSVSVRSRPMAKALIQNGIVPRKSFVSFSISSELAKSRHFWRGAIDGDGSIGWANNTYPKLYLSSSCKKLISQFMFFLNEHGLYSGNELLAYRNDTFFLYQQTSGPAIKILKLLYDNSRVYIDRKYEKANELINCGRKQKVVV